MLDLEQLEVSLEELERHLGVEVELESGQDFALQPDQVLLAQKSRLDLVNQKHHIGEAGVL